MLRQPKTYHQVIHSPLDTADDRVLVMVLRLAVVPLPVSSLPSLFLVRCWNERKLAMGISLESALPLAVKRKSKLEIQV